jgi:hypothetical protein
MQFLMRELAFMTTVLSLDPPKSTPVAHGGNPQDRAGSP